VIIGALLAGAISLAGCAIPSSKPLVSAPPSASADDFIYVSDVAGRIRALRSDGTQHWSYSLADDLAQAADVASHDLHIDFLTARSAGKLFGLATVESGRFAGRKILFALDGNRLLWHREAPPPEPGTAPIAVGGNAVYEASDDGSLYAFARADGRPMWQYRVSNGTLGSPVVGADGTIYVTGPGFNLHAIAPDGSQRWVIGTGK
jgi:outer membrane protein assembly factor BamB